MLALPRSAKRLLGPRTLAGAGVGTLLFVALLATPQLLGSRVVAAIHGLDHADPRWLWLAGLGFLCSLAGSAGSWHSAVALCGGRLSLTWLPPTWLPPSGPSLS